LKSDRKTLGKGKTQGLLGAISDSKREAAIGKEFKKRGREMARIRRNFYRRNSKKKALAKSFKATCADCGKEVLLEVPPLGKDLLCLDCFNKKGVQ